jgi:hypothetical protein
VALNCEEHLLSVIVTIEMAIMAAASVSVTTKSCGYSSLIQGDQKVSVHLMITV